MISYGISFFVSASASIQKIKKAPNERSAPNSPNSASGNRILRAEINFVRVEITLVRAVITFVPVEITLCVEITLYV
jgi:hypothetical protein